MPTAAVVRLLRRGVHLIRFAIGFVATANR
jgi:hypothetical protein